MSIKLTKEEKSLITEIRKIKKCCGTTIADFDIEALELNQVACVKCDTSVAFMEIEGQVVPTWNKKVSGK